MPEHGEPAGCAKCHFSPEWRRWLVLMSVFNALFSVWLFYRQATDVNAHRHTAIEVSK